jgi:hypothetical protein
MSISANYPNLRPTLLADFFNTQQVDSRFSFTRSTTATYYDGKTNALAEQNMFLQSNAFTTSWTNNNITPTQTATDPFGNANTAWVLNEGTNTGVHGVTQQIPITSQVQTTYTLSVYAQNVTGQFLQLSFYTALSYAGATAIFDLSTGVVTSQLYGYPILGATITLVSGTWYRCTLTATLNQNVYTGAFAGYIAMSNSSQPTTSSLGYLNSYSGTSNTINIYGAQFEQRTYANVYQPTTTAFISNFIPQLLTAQPNVPRFAIDPSTSVCTGLIRELSSTNLLTYSSDFSNAYWYKGILSVTSNVTIAPDGTQTAILVTSTGTGNNYIGLATALSTTASSTYTRSFYAKAGTATVVGVGDGQVVNDLGYFNLSTGVATAQNGSTVSMTAVGNGWYRCSSTYTSSGTSSQFRIYQGTIFPGTNGTGTFYLWGAQFENNNYASSYIPTVQAQVTRAQDYIESRGDSLNSWYFQGQGTLYSEMSMFVTTAPNGLVEINNNTQSSYANVGQGTFTSNIPAKSAVSYNSSGLVAQSGVTATASAQLVATQLQIGVGRIYYSNSCIIKKIAYYPQPFTTAQLQALTGS